MKPENDIHFENELLKLKLQAEHGMHFFGEIGEGIVPPELMHDFLSQIEAFENALPHAKKTTVGAFLGHPVWKPSDEIADEALGAALAEVRAQMAQKDICLDAIYPTPDRVIYRFITEELIDFEIEDVHVPGMTNNFIYEEFHPNHREEVRKRCREFFRFFFSPGIENFPEIYMTSEMAADLAWQYFRESFEDFSNVKCKATELRIEGLQATMTYELTFTGHLKGEAAGVPFAGVSKLSLVGDDHGWWQVAHFQLPVQQD